VITIKNYMFSPKTLTVHVGTVVTVVNDSTVTHTWTSSDGAFNSGPILPGASYSHTFEDAGTFAYHCTFHPFMTGTVVVVAG